jgi:hypothetical protein
MRPLTEQVLIQSRRETPALQPDVCEATFDALVREIELKDPSYKQ